MCYGSPAPQTNYADTVPTKPTPTSRRIIDWILPGLLLIGATVLIRAYGIDQKIAAWFFRRSGEWAAGFGQPWIFLKHYGLTLTLSMSIGALVIWLASFRIKRLACYRRVATYLTLTMIIGPGLIVNTLFKENWERPRPLDLVELNGDSEFVEVWSPPVPGSGNSFPSGHAATAFYLFTPYLILRNQTRRWAVVFLVAGFAFGALMGYCRMLQGAHFFSDVIWACGFVYFTALALSYALRLDSQSAHPTGEPTQTGT